MQSSFVTPVLKQMIQISRPARQSYQEERRFHTISVNLISYKEISNRTNVFRSHEAAQEPIKFSL